MRTSRATWRLGFSAAPDEARLSQARELLSPIERAERSPEHGRVLAEWGMHEYLFVEPAANLDAGELALALLSRAHRLGSGWRVMWPGYRREGQGWPREEVARAGLPDSLAGLEGSWQRDGAARAAVPGLEFASFVVEVLPEMVAAPQAAPSTARPSALPPASADGGNVSLLAVLDDLLTRFRGLPWTWHPATDRLVLQTTGLRVAQEEADMVVLNRPDGLVARLCLAEGRVKALEFVLASRPDPHLLEETEFDRVQRQYETHFSDCVARASSVLGTPAFAGASGESGFPRDRWADWAAIWEVGGRRILVEQRQDDRELPLEICLVFAPAA